MTRLLSGLIAATLLTAPMAANAHRQWLLPSTTVLSGEKAWVTVDAAVSNDLFFPDHTAMRLDGVTIVAPDGTVSKPENGWTGKVRSTFDLQLTQQGTYKVMTGNAGIMGSYKLNGEEKRLPRGTTAEQLATAIPAGATDVKIGETSSRNEIFLTLGAPSDTVIKPTGKGLELEPITHPSDLVQGEPAKFRFLIDGKAAADLAVTVIPGGIKYRSAPNELSLKTDKDGVVTINWPTPGMYWLNASSTGGKPTVPQATQRRMSYIATIEVQAP